MSPECVVDRKAEMRLYVSCHLRLLYDVFVFPDEYLKVFCERVLDVLVRWGGEKIVHQDEHDERGACEQIQHLAL